MTEQESQQDKIWRGFRLFCKELDFGEIETLKIQNGVPMMAEVVRKKIKLS